VGYSGAATSLEFSLSLSSACASIANLIRLSVSDNLFSVLCNGRYVFLLIQGY
jgi:hypothetical protein